MTNTTITNNHHSYPSNTAGRLMSTNIPVIPASATILDAEKVLLGVTQSFDTINYVYVVNKQQNLVGVASIKEIFRQSKSTPIKQIMATELITARPHTDQERVAYRALKNQIKSVPVVDKKGKLLGVVQSDDILSIMHQETSEDLFHMAGIPDEEAQAEDPLNAPIFISLKHRLPWLFVGLLGGLLTATIIGSFQSMLAERLLLVAFIPLISYMSGAIAMQAQVFFIRAIAINPKMVLSKFFIRQIAIIAMIAIIISTTLFLISSFFLKDMAIATLLSVALFAAVLSSVLTGLVIPYFFSRVTRDPADASGPIATVIQDLLSVTLYFLVASLLL